MHISIIAGAHILLFKKILTFFCFMFLSLVTSYMDNPICFRVCSFLVLIFSLLATILMLLPLLLWLPRRQADSMLEDQWVLPFHPPSGKFIFNLSKSFIFIFLTFWEYILLGNIWIYRIPTPKAKVSQRHFLFVSI